MSAQRRLAVDLLYFNGRRGGVETYARQLLPRMAPLLDGIELVAITGTTGARAVREWFPGEVRQVPVDTTNHVGWAAAEVLAAGSVAARAGASLLWCPANLGPGAGSVPRLVTVHDVTVFDYPSAYLGRIGQASTKALLRLAARGATRVLTASEDAAQRVAEIHGVPRERMSVVPHGASPTPVPGDSPAVVARLGVPTGRPMVLSVGNRMPHKNLDNLVRAIAEIPTGRRPVLVAAGGPPADPLRPLVGQLGLTKDVLLPGWVTSEQLGALQHEAALYACPSLAEGFGLPVLDAMLANCAVLASDIGVLREVGGDAAAYVDTRDPAAFAGAIEGLLADDDRRARMRAAGLVRAQQFTWDRAARQTVDVVLRTLTEAAR